MTTFFARITPKHIGWEPYLYLVFLGFLFFQPFFDPEFGPAELGADPRAHRRVFARLPDELRLRR